MSNIELVLEKYQFAAGEPVKGKLVLRLDKIIKASKLSVGIVVSQLDRMQNRPIPGMGVSLNGVSFSSTKSTGEDRKLKVLYRFDLPLDGEKEYMDGEYPFEFMIPPQIEPYARRAPATIPEGVLGTVFKVLSQISTLSASVVYMYSVEGRLAVPWGFDVVNKVDITLI